MSQLVPFERGDFKVMIACCAWGNCSRCHGGGNLSRRKWHAISNSLGERFAQHIALSWKNFDAYVAPMNEAEKQKAAAVAAWFAGNKQRGQRTTRT